MLHSILPRPVPSVMGTKAPGLKSTTSRDANKPVEEPSDATTLCETDDEEETALAYESEEETQIAQAMARAAFTKSKSTPMLNLLLKQAFEEQAVEAPSSCSSSTQATLKRAYDQVARSKLESSKLTRIAFKKQRRESVRMSASEPSLKTLTHHKTTGITKTVSKSSPKPNDKLKTIMFEQGHTVQFHSYMSLPGFFIKLQPEHVASYDTELVRAVRDENLEVLEKRERLYAGNKFGETILHAACRRGSERVVNYLIDVGEHPVRVCCDYGRTILHDAAWTCEPNWRVMDAILDACPDLLYITDRRGFCPLDYVPAEQYGIWCDYLEARGARKLQPHMLK